MTPMKTTEQTTAHTPGPWVADTKTYRAPMILNHTGKMTVANSINGETGSEAEANARLIAAAPELLNELKDLAGFVRKFGDSIDRASFMRAADGYLVAAKQAIARATQP